MDTDGSELLEVARTGEYAVVRDPTGEWWAEFLDTGANFDYLLGSVYGAFFRDFQDDYEFLNIVIVRELGLPFAFCQPLANDVTGLGFSGEFDETPDNRVEAMIFMNEAARWIEDPVVGRYVFEQEVMHRWGAYVGVAGLPDQEHLGRDGMHWSFWMDTPNSPMEGNRWVDNGDGTWTTDGAAVSTYSELDLYLMGFMEPEEVPQQTLLVPTHGLDGNDASSKPIGHAGESDLTVEATAIHFGIEDIIAVEGRRRPGAGNSPRQFHMAMIVVLLHDDVLTPDLADELDAMRVRWEEDWEEDVRGLATLDTTLGPNTAPDFFAPWEKDPPGEEVDDACSCETPGIASGWLLVVAGLAVRRLRARRRA